MMRELLNSSQVRRFHTNARLAHVPDQLAAHQWRVAMLYLHLTGDVAGLPAALTHDVGEYITGDMPGPASPEHKPEEEAARLRIVGGIQEHMKSADMRVLRFCDKLDALWFATLHGQGGTDEWQQARIECWDMASTVGADAMVLMDQVLGDA